MKVIAGIIGGLVVAMTVTAGIAALAATAAKRHLVRADDPQLDEVHLAAIFEPLSFRSESAAFRGGTIDAWFGGGIIDLRDATLDPSGARLAVRAIFGGAQVVVPESWNVVTNVRGLGGIGDGRPDGDRPSDAPQLTIDGVVAFGGFGVTSELSEDARRSVEDAVARRAAGRAGSPAS